MEKSKNNQSSNQTKGGNKYSSLLWALGAFETFILAICFAFVYGRIMNVTARITCLIIFAVVAAVSFIIAVRKNSALKDYSNDDTDFPWLCFAFWAFVLLGITSIITALVLWHWFAALIITIIFCLILAIIGMIKGWDRCHNNKNIKPAMFFAFLIITVLIASLLISIIVVCVAPCNPCKDGHNFKDGECTACGFVDPDYEPSVEDPCKEGHDFKDGKCIVCGVDDPDYIPPVEDPCKEGHDFKDGKCTVCGVDDPDYIPPVEDPCKEGHDFKDGKCTVCGVDDPDYVEPKFIDPPKTMKYGEPVNLKFQGINADNLVYGNKSFVEVKKVSDNEVMITLTVPAAGYITVTDYVSGVSIEITVVG